MNPADLETVYEALATHLDSLEEEKHALFLSKLALLLSHESKDGERVRALIDEAAQNLDV